MTGTSAHRSIGRVAAVCSALIATIAIGTSLFGTATASPPHHLTLVSPPLPATGLSRAASALGAATADEALGFPSAVFEPPAAPDPEAPGVIISAVTDQPDAFIFDDGGQYDLFSSALTVGLDQTVANVPVRTSSVVGGWGLVRDALRMLPPWAQEGATWAPDVHKFGSHYVLYFTSAVRYAGAHIECIGDAYSTAATGPYLASPSPFVCQLADGGSIDPRTFVDGDGTPYLLWKSDNNADGSTPTAIYSQQLSANGLHLLGQPTRIFGPDEPWQGTIVEAPDLVEVLGQYFLFYSGNWFNQSSYAIGVARCSGPAGPCADTSSAPLLASNTQGDGPGEESVFSNAQGVWLLYSPFRSTLPLPGPPRPVAMAHLGFGPGGPYLAAPPTAAQATPVATAVTGSPALPPAG